MSNLLLMIAVARAVTPIDFGVFSLVIMFYALAVRGVRSVVSTPLLMSVAGEGAEHVRAEVRGSIGASLLVGVALAAPAAALSLILGGTAGWLLGTLALLIPILLVHDGVRYAFTANGKTVWSAACDVSWLILQVLFTLPLVFGAARDVVAYTAAWGAAGAFAAIGGLVVLRVRPSPREGREFLNRHRRLLPDLAHDFVTASLVVQLAPYAVAVVAGLAAAGALRAGLVLLGVVNVVIMGMTPLAQVEATTLHKRAPDRDHTFVTAWAAILVGVSVAYGTLLVALPNSVGLELLGDTWTQTSTLLIPLALCMVANSPYSAIQISLRARSQLRAALRVRLRTAPLLPVLAAAGAAAFGAQGAAWGLAVAAVVTSAYAARVLGRVAADQRRTESAVVVQPPESFSAAGHAVSFEGWNPR